MDKLKLLYFLSIVISISLVFSVSAEVKAKDEASEKLYLLLSMLLAITPLVYMKLAGVHNEVVFHIFAFLYGFFLGRIVYRFLIRKLL